MSDLDDLRAELDEFATSPKNPANTSIQERVLSDFQDIVGFIDRCGRLPAHGEDKDIFERLYSLRLDRIRLLYEHHELLSKFDKYDLLKASNIHDSGKALGPVDTDQLMSELIEIKSSNEISQLKHVRPTSEIKAAEEIANREKCVDFDKFRPLFSQIEDDLKEGVRVTKPYEKEASIEAGNFFIVYGQIAYVAEQGELFKAPNGATDARLRVIYSNGTESNLLRRSLQRALYKDEAGRRITEPSAGPLFSDVIEEGDIESGTIYVLRSNSSHPYITEHRQLLHKIGVTGGKVETRIANAAIEATYLLAEVEIVATYKLSGINRTKLENLFHRIFSEAQLNLTIYDRFGHPVKPREWFLVPLDVIDEVVNRIRDGSITSYIYDPKSAQLIQRA